MNKLAFFKIVKTTLLFLGKIHHIPFTEEKMIRLSLTQQEIDERNYLRFHHPDPIVMKRCQTVHLKAKNLKPKQIRELTGFNTKMIRAHLRLYENGGIETLKHREPYRPQGELEDHIHSIEQEFRDRPPASIQEAVTQKSSAQ